MANNKNILLRCFQQTSKRGHPKEATLGVQPGVLTRPVALHSTPLHSTPLHSTPLHSTPLHSTPLHSTPLHSSPFIFPIFLTSLRIFFTLNNCAIWTTKQKVLNVSDCGVHGVIPSLLDSARRFSIFCGDRTFSMQPLSTFSKKDAPSCCTKRAYSLRKFCIVFPLFSVFFF